MFYMFWKVFEKENMSINRKFKNSGSLKGVEKVKFFPKRFTTHKISNMKP